jgi:hypothetical protein
MWTRIVNKQILLTAILMAGAMANIALGQVMSKSQVANLISKVEDGVDKFRDYLDKRGDDAKNAASASGGQTPRGRKPTEAQKNTAKTKKDALDDSLGDLNRSTNKLKRKFDATDTWMTTKGEVQKVVDDGRSVNQALTKGSYGTEAARLWSVLRAAINDLARAYAITPLGA